MPNSSPNRQKVHRGPFLPWWSCRNCIALSALQVYRAQTLWQKHDPLWGYRRLSYSRHKYVCRLVFRVFFPRGQIYISGVYSKKITYIRKWPLQLFSQGEWLQSFTQYACKGNIRDWQKAYTTLASAYRRVSLFQYRRENTEVTIVGPIFL